MKAPYVPDRLPLSGLDHARLITLVGQANAELARYDGLLQAIVNPDVMLSPLTTQEAVLSSRIEGTQATLDDVLRYEAGEERQGASEQDIQEIINYRTALGLAREWLEDRPITLGLVLELHRVLMNSVRGRNKAPGVFRKEQNWIGRPGCTIEEASFIPPSPLTLLDHLQAWEAYLRGDDIDVLVQLAVVHAQFELIHPFLDGNGRIGRLLIPAFLVQKRVLTGPNFYLSSYLESHRDVYYDRLRAISRDGDWNGWIAFFLHAVVVQARDNAARVREMLALYDSMKITIAELTRSQYAIRALDMLFTRPILQATDFIDRGEIPRQRAVEIVRRLREGGVLQTLREPRGRRPAIFASPPLLEIIDRRRVV